MLPFQKDVQVYNTTYNSTYNSNGYNTAYNSAYNTLNNKTYNTTSIQNNAYNPKLCFDDLLKISQRDFKTQQFNSQQPFNAQFNSQQPFGTQFNSQQFNNNQLFNTQQLNTPQLNNIDASCANCMSSLFNLSPFESLPTTNNPTTNITTTNMPTTNIPANTKNYDEIDMNIEELLIPLTETITQNLTQNIIEQKNVVQQKVAEQKMFEQKVIEQKPLEENRLQQNQVKQNLLQQTTTINTTTINTTTNITTTSQNNSQNDVQNDTQLYLPQQNTHNYKSVVSFVDRVLDHFNALTNLNKMTPKHRYKREYIFNIWKQTIICAKQGLIPLPYPLLHKSYIKDQNQNTIAMILASQKIYVPKHWTHKATLINKFGETVAIIYAKNGIIPPQEWKHAYDITCSENGQTVFMLLVENYCRQQIYDKKNISKQQQSKQQLKFEQWLQNIPSYWIHSDEIMDKYGQTVSSILSSNGLKLK